MILRIKDVMKEQGFSREDLAEAVGKSKATISNICSEKNYPSYQLLVEIADALNVDVRELLVNTKPGKVDEAKKLIEEALKLM